MEDNIEEIKLRLEGTRSWVYRVPNLFSEITIVVLSEPNPQHNSIDEIILRQLTPSVKISMFGFCYPGEIHVKIQIGSGEHAFSFCRQQSSAVAIECK